MASPDDTTQQAEAAKGADRSPSVEEAASSAPPHYQHPFPFTIVPNCFIDDYLPQLSATAQSVMLVLYRLTLGWHRGQTFISQKELRQRTGIASYTTLNTALRELLAAGLITVSDQRGQRRLQGYCLTPAALSAPESGVLHDAQHPHNVQKMHTPSEERPPSATESGVEPLQKLEQYRYRNRSGSATESGVLTSSQPAQGKVPDKPKERLKKAKEMHKEIDRYVRMQNEMQKAGEEHTNPLQPTESLARLLEQQPLLHASAIAVSPQPDEQASVPHETTSPQPGSPLEAESSTPTVLPRQPSSGPNQATERWRFRQHQSYPPTGEEAEDLAARRLRLLALQQELAQLKRTPSMQLLARQRIPRLEEAIKHLIASLAASA